MKIAFVHPNWIDGLGAFSKIAKKRSPAPNMGTLYLAAIAEHLGHQVRMFDCDVDDLSVQNVAFLLAKEGYEIVGITATSPIFHKAEELARLLKESGCKIKVLIGGTHINIFKKDVFSDCFDYGFFGESERNFEQFLKILERGDLDFSTMKGFIYRDHGQVVQTVAGEMITDLDSLPFPAVHLLNLDHYISTFGRKYKPKRVISIVPTRGCPFKCVFCSEARLNNKLRCRSPKNVVDEMEHWHKTLGVSHFWFAESNITLVRERIEGICHEIIRRKLNITFEGATRADLVDEKLFRLMKSAGLIRISYGLETGSPRIMKIIRKEESLEDIRRAIQLSDSLDIETNVSAMIGLPGDTRESVNETINFIRDTPGILYTTFGIANPYPGSEMYDWALVGKHGFQLIEKEYSQYSRYERSPVKVNDLGPEDLLRLQRIGLLKIHLKPRRMIAAIRMIGFVEIAGLFFNMVGFVIREKVFSGIVRKSR
ncbi:MAG: radical SAM protein [Candidatus Omnitrophota bacterium]